MIACCIERAYRGLIPSHKFFFMILFILKLHCCNTRWYSTNQNRVFPFVFVGTLRAYKILTFHHGWLGKVKKCMYISVYKDNLYCTHAISFALLYQHPFFFFFFREIHVYAVTVCMHTWSCFSTMIFYILFYCSGIYMGLDRTLYMYVYNYICTCI